MSCRSVALMSALSLNGCAVVSMPGASIVVAPPADAPAWMRECSSLLGRAAHGRWGGGKITYGSEGLGGTSYTLELGRDRFIAEVVRKTEGPPPIEGWAFFPPEDEGILLATHSVPSRMAQISMHADPRKSEAFFKAFSPVVDRCLKLPVGNTP